MSECGLFRVGFHGYCSWDVISGVLSEVVGCMASDDGSVSTGEREGEREMTHTHTGEREREGEER